MPPMRSKSGTGLSNIEYQPCPSPDEESKTISKSTQGKVYKSSSHSALILQNLNLLRQNNKFCDVEIVAKDAIIKAHRSVLSASSPYFRAMFASGLMEVDKERIEIHYIQPHILEIIIDFIYTGEVKLCQENVQDLIVACDMLELKEMIHSCTEFLRNELHISNAMGIYRFAVDHNCLELAETSKNFIENNFPGVSSEEEFCELPKDPLIEFLDSELLKVDSEYQVFEAVMRWINYDLVRRKRYVFELLRHVRLPLISLTLLERTIADTPDASLKIALKSVKKDLTLKKGNLVPLLAYPRQSAKKSIYLIGGSKREMLKWTKSFEWTYDTIEKFDTYSGEWQRDISPMAIGRILPGVAALNGKIYVVGGEHDSQILADGEVYDPNSNTWTSVAPMVVPRCEFGLCAFEGQLYALGGWVGDDIGGSIERYDPIRDKWQLQGSLPEPRFSMGVVSYDGLIYIVGGCTHSRRHLTDVFCFNPVTGEWQALAPMLQPRSQLGVAILDGYLYVVGGINKEPDVLRSVERYSFEQNKWSSCGMLKVGRASPAVAAVNGYLYVMGGDQTQSNFYRASVTIDSVERYCPEKELWDEAPPLPESRSEAAAIVL